MSKSKVTPRLAEGSWPCPNCGYELRASFDHQLAREATCPECGRSSGWKEVLQGREAATPAGIVWWLSALSPAVIALALIVADSMAIIPMSMRYPGYPLAMCFCLCVPAICAVYRYRRYPTWYCRPFLAFPVYFIVLFYNFIIFVFGSLLIELIWWLEIP